jgi:hypothetical protein
MPVFQYFGWVGSFLLATLVAASWCLPAPSASRADIPLDQKIKIRIHTDHKWPERVVFDTTRSTLVQEANAESGLGGTETPVPAERRRTDAFAEMAAVPVGPCFRPPCSVQPAEPLPIEKSAPFQNRQRLPTTARKDFSFPNPLHKLPGKN